MQKKFKNLNKKSQTPFFVVQKKLHIKKSKRYYKNYQENKLTKKKYTTSLPTKTNSSIRETVSHSACADGRTDSKKKKNHLSPVTCHLSSVACHLSHNHLKKGRIFHRFSFIALTIYTAELFQDFGGKASVHKTMWVSPVGYRLS